MHLPTHTLGICLSTRGTSAKLSFPVVHSNSHTHLLVLATQQTQWSTICTQTCTSQCILAECKTLVQRHPSVHRNVHMCIHRPTQGRLYCKCVQIVLYAHITHANYNISVCTSHMNAPCTYPPHICMPHTCTHYTLIHITHAYTSCTSIL